MNPIYIENPIYDAPKPYTSRTHKDTLIESFKRTPNSLTRKPKTRNTFPASGRLELSWKAHEDVSQVLCAQCRPQ